LSPPEPAALSRRTLLNGVVGLAMAAPSLGRAATNVPAPAQGFIDAVNGDTAARTAWIDGAMSSAGLARNSPGDLQILMARLRSASGGLDLVGATEQPQVLRLKVRARATGRVRQFDLRKDRDDPRRIFDPRPRPGPTPCDRPAPETPLGLPALRAALARRFAFAIEQRDFSGAARVVAPNGEVVFEIANGLADVGTGEVVTPAHRFNLGSADKSFTAILIGRLVSEGRLSFDTPVIEIVPDYANKTAAKAMTVRHLLTHAAGLGGLWERPGYDKAKPHDHVAQLLPAFWAADPAFEPGAGARYSNEGFVLLGAIVERLTGRSWWDELADKVYAPAEMTHSAHLIAGRPTSLKATGYRFEDGDDLGLGQRQANLDFVGYRGNSCGGGYASVGDMTAYLRALRAGKLLDPALAETMTRQAVGGLADYGMGFQIQSFSGRTVRGHGGGGPFSGIDGRSGVVWETGWAYSILGNYDAPFVQVLADDVGRMLAAQAV
jgi:CubicO group peptidase (beta-lactamase class C family)